MNSNHFQKHKCHGCSGHSAKPCSTVQNRCHALGPFLAVDSDCIPDKPKKAYGSLFNTLEVPVSVANGDTVTFETPGPLLNVAPTRDMAVFNGLQVATSGVYEISMHLGAILNETTSPTPTQVAFALFINGTKVPGSTFGSFIQINSTITIANSIGTTIQRRLNPNDILSIEVATPPGVIGSVQYALPSLVVTKIAE